MIEERVNVRYNQYQIDNGLCMNTLRGFHIFRKFAYVFVYLSVCFYIYIIIIIIRLTQPVLAIGD